MQFGDWARVAGGSFSILIAIAIYFFCLREIRKGWNSDLGLAGKAEILIGSVVVFAMICAMLALRLIMAYSGVYSAVDL